METLSRVYSLCSLFLCVLLSTGFTAIYVMVCIVTMLKIAYSKIKKQLYFYLQHIILITSTKIKNVIEVCSNSKAFLDMAHVFMI